MGVEAVDVGGPLINFVSTILIVLNTERGWFIIIFHKFQLHQKVFTLFSVVVKSGSVELVKLCKAIRDQGLATRESLYPQIATMNH